MPSLEEIEIHGPGFDSLEVDFALQLMDVLPPAEAEAEEPILQINNLLKLDGLGCLSILSTHVSPLMLALYDDLLYLISFVSKFIQIHRLTLRSLHFCTPKDVADIDF